MRAVVQRVLRATLDVGADQDADAGMTRHAEIGAGLVALVGIEQGDGEAELVWLAGKLPVLRIFEDDAGKMNRSLLDLVSAGEGTEEGGVTGEPAGLLVVPNFTVAGRARKGRRPDFTTAKPPGEAAAMFATLVERLRAESPGVAVRAGVFGAHMHVSLVNDGPVTIWLDSAEK